MLIKHFSEKMFLLSITKTFKNFKLIKAKVKFSVTMKTWGERCRFSPVGHNKILLVAK